MVASFLNTAFLFSSKRFFLFQKRFCLLKKIWLLNIEK